MDISKPRLLALVVGMLFAASASAYELKEFHILAGTGTGEWNAADATVEVKVGDVLRIHNDDSVDHQLHTNGAPCEHGPNMAPGEAWDCAIEYPFDPAVSGNVYDHHVGPKAAFHLHAVP